MNRAVWHDICRERERERERERRAGLLKRNPPRFFDGNTLNFNRYFISAATLLSGSVAAFLCDESRKNINNHNKYQIIF